ncbi:MAG: primosomal protein N' [Coriobacteriales bacterium]|jgi:primosomal protein N' (replication factor Y)|nr:primosomal protein N' [Coriobacteriales bacterium]
MAFAQVALDIPARSLDETFLYQVPQRLENRTQVGCCVLVDFARRPCVGYVMGLAADLGDEVDPACVKPLRDVLAEPYFDEAAAALAVWTAREYVAPLSEAVRLFTPPGPSPRLIKDPAGVWCLERAGTGPVDERWAVLAPDGRDYTPPARAAKQRAILAALRIGEVRVAELGIHIANPLPSLQALERRGVVRIELRRRLRGEAARSGQCAQEAIQQSGYVAPADDIQALTEGQRDALSAIREAPPGTAVLIDGVTGSGKTEVYLQAIRRVLSEGGSALVLVPEISLTPQTVARFRSRFGSLVAILHSRLGLGERFDEWDRVRAGEARVVIGARSALFAPVQRLRLIIIDEEHESSYKQGSSPRYVTRDVALRRAELVGAVLVCGSATPSYEALWLCGSDPQRWRRVKLTERATGQPLPAVQVIDLAAEFHIGNKTMFSAALKGALLEVVQRREKAVVLLNKRGFASFLLCRDCGFVPMCDQCATSLTYHARPLGLLCHQCGKKYPLLTQCPACKSPYLKELGPGTQFAEEQLAELLPPETPIVRMDADTTRGRSGHESCLERFIAADHGVLLGTQMIAKGLDFPEVTLVGVLVADLSLKLPDFRAAERTFQLLEQVAGRAGRASKDGRVIIQTYWPEHPAIRAAAAHDRAVLIKEERIVRAELGYPPYGRLADVVVWGKELGDVVAHINAVALALREVLPVGWQLLGPSPCALAKRQGDHRWHILLKAPPRADVPGVLGPFVRALKRAKGVKLAVDIDPYDMM